MSRFDGVLVNQFKLESSSRASLSLSVAMASLLTLATAAVLPRQASGSISCDQGSANTIQVSDIQELITNLNNNNIPGFGQGSFDLASQLTLNQASAETVTQGSLTILLNNKQPFASTHVAFTTVTQALQQYQDICCGSFSSCIGGDTGVAGDTGLVVDLKISPA
jgi:hypothetical protein